MSDMADALRRLSKSQQMVFSAYTPSMLDEAAEEITRLRAEIERLTAERDAAVRALVFTEQWPALERLIEIAARNEADPAIEKLAAMLRAARGEQS